MARDSLLLQIFQSFLDIAWFIFVYQNCEFINAVRCFFFFFFQNFWIALESFNWIQKIFFSPEESLIVIILSFETFRCKANIDLSSHSLWRSQICLCFAILQGNAIRSWRCESLSDVNSRGLSNFISLHQPIASSTCQAVFLFFLQSHFVVALRNSPQAIKAKWESTRFRNILSSRLKNSLVSKKSIITSLTMNLANPSSRVTD